MNLIIRAIKRNELHVFLMGEGKYHLAVRGDLPAPNDYNKSWELYLIPYIKNHDDENFKQKFKEALLKLLKYETDPNLGIYTVLLTLNWYYFYKVHEHLSLEINFDDIAPKIKNKLIELEVNLKNDQRWSGIKWNSPNGLWTPLLRTATYIKEKYNGIDVLPDNINPRG